MSCREQITFMSCQAGPEKELVGVVGLLGMFNLIAHACLPDTDEPSSASVQ